MAKTTLFYYANTDDVNNGTFLPVGSAFATLPGSTTEAEMQAVLGAAGVLSDLWLRAAAGGASRTLKVRNGGVNTNITVSPTGAGEFTDGVNTNTVAANDLIGVAFAGGDITPEALSVVFDADSDTVFLLNMTDNNGDTIAGTDFQVMMAATPAANTVLAQAHLLRSAGTFIRTYIFIRTSSGVCTATLYKNASSTTQVVTTTASTTGLFEFTGAAVSYSAGDTIQMELIEVSGSINYSTYGTTCISTNSKQDVIGKTASARTASGTATFWPINGQEANAAAEARIKFEMQYAGTASNLRIHANTNTYSADATFTLRKNGVDTGVVVTHTAGSTSSNEDTTNSVTFVKGDELSLSYVGGSSGSLGANATYGLTLEADVVSARRIFVT